MSTTTVSNRFKYELLAGTANCATDDFKVLLMRSNFSFDKDLHLFKKNVKTTTGAITVTINNSDNTITRSTGSFVDDGFVTGNKITIDAGDNAGEYLVSAVSTLYLTITTVAGGNPVLVDESSVTRTIASDDEIDTEYGYTKDTYSFNMSSVTIDTVNDRGSGFMPTIMWTASGGSIGATRGALFYDDSITNDPIVGFIDFDEDVTVPDGVDLKILNGELRISTAS